MYVEKSMYHNGSILEATTSTPGMYIRYNITGKTCSIHSNVAAIFYLKINKHRNTDNTNRNTDNTNRNTDNTNIGIQITQTGIQITQT